MSKLYLDIINIINYNFPLCKTDYFSLILFIILDFFKFKSKNNIMFLKNMK